MSIDLKKIAEKLKDWVLFPEALERVKKTLKSITYEFYFEWTHPSAKNWNSKGITILAQSIEEAKRKFEIEQDNRINQGLQLFPSSDLDD